MQSTTYPLLGHALETADAMAQEARLDAKDVRHSTTTSPTSITNWPLSKGWKRYQKEPTSRNGAPPWATADLLLMAEHCRSRVTDDVSPRHKVALTKNLEADRLHPKMVRRAVVWLPRQWA